jgi:hypothetical protein
MEFEIGESSSPRDRMGEALQLSLQAMTKSNTSRQCEEVRGFMVTDTSPNTVTQFGRIGLPPRIAAVAAMIEEDEDLPYDELRQVLDNRMDSDTSFFSEAFHEQVPKSVSESFDEPFDAHASEPFEEPFDEQVSEESVAEPVAEPPPEPAPELKPVLVSVAESLLDEDSSIDNSESNVYESDENSSFDESESLCSIHEYRDGNELELLEEVTSFTEDEIEVHLGETSLLIEEIGGIQDIKPKNVNDGAEDDDNLGEMSLLVEEIRDIQDIKPKNGNDGAEDDDKSEVTSVNEDDDTVNTGDGYDSDASWTSDPPAHLPSLFKDYIFQRLSGEFSAMTGTVVKPLDIREEIYKDPDESTGVGSWF